MAHSEEKRVEQFVLKLHKSELDALVHLAEANFRRPGDQLRFMIAAECARVAAAKVAL